MDYQILFLWKKNRDTLLYISKYNFKYQNVALSYTTCSDCVYFPKKSHKIHFYVNKLKKKIKKKSKRTQESSLLDKQKRANLTLFQVVALSFNIKSKDAFKRS